LHGIRAEVLGSIPLGHTFFSAVHNNFHLHCCSLSTHTTRAHDRDSHARGGMLDYSIRGPLAPSISPGFYGWTGRGEESSSTYIAAITQTVTKELKCLFSFSLSWLSFFYYLTDTVHNIFLCGLGLMKYIFYHEI
jgi:hypothetical protein